jgi:hypothetical protein
LKLIFNFNFNSRDSKAIMVITRTIKPASADLSGARAWRCEECGKFHVKTRSVLLTLSQAEFEDFVYEVAGCLYGQSGLKLASQENGASGNLFYSEGIQ